MASPELQGHNEGEGHLEGQIIVRTKIHYKYEESRTPSNEVKYRIHRKSGSLYRSASHLTGSGHLTGSRGQLTRSGRQLNKSLYEDVDAEMTVTDRLCRSKSEGFICEEKNKREDGGKVNVTLRYVKRYVMVHYAML